MVRKLLESSEEVWVLEPADQAISECLYQGYMHRTFKIEGTPRLRGCEAVSRLAIEVACLVGKSQAERCMNTTL